MCEDLLKEVRNTSAQRVVGPGIGPDHLSNDQILQSRQSRQKGSVIIFQIM